MGGESGWETGNERYPGAGVTHSRSLCERLVTDCSEAFYLNNTVSLGDCRVATLLAKTAVICHYTPRVLLQDDYAILQGATQ